MRGSIALATSLGLAVAAAGALAAVAIRESNEADAQRDVAASRALAAAALDNLDRSPDLAMLLALEAYRRVDDRSAENSYEARHSLVSTLTRLPRLKAVLRVDDEAAAAVSFSPDGSRLAASSEDGTIRLWNLAARSENSKPMRGTPTCYTAPFDVDVRFTPDGETLVQTSCGIATVFDVERGKRRQTVGGSSDSLSEEETDSALSSDGRMLAFFGEYVGFRLLDTLTGARIRRGVGAGHDQLFPIAFSGDGRVLAGSTAFVDDPARLWEVESGARLGKSLPGRLLALGPTGDMAAVLKSGKVRLWDVARTAYVGKPFTVASVLRGAFDETGKRLAVSSDDGWVRVWRLTRSGRAHGVVRLRHDGVAGIRFSPDGRMLATAGMDGTVRLWDVAQPRALAVRIYGAGGEVAFSPDGRWLASNGDYAMALWSVAKDGIVGAPRVVDRGIGYDIEFSPDGRTVASAFQEPGAIGLWDVASKRSRPLPTHEYATESVAFSPDGRLLASAGDGVKFWDPSTRAEIGRRLRGGFDSVAFSPDGRLLATWRGPEYPGGDGADTIKFWDVGERVLVGEPLPTGANDLAFSPNGRTLAVAQYDGSIGLWDITRRTLTDRLRGHAATSLLACCAGANAVAFSPDGLVLASGGRDGLRLWDSTRAAPLGDPVRGFDPDVWDVAFSPDGQMLVSAHDNGTLLWDAILLSRDLEEWQSRLCAIASRNLTEAEWRRFLPGESYRKTCPPFS